MQNSNKIVIEEYNHIYIINPVEYINFKQINITIPRKIKTDEEIIQEAINELENLDEKHNILEHYNKKLLEKLDFFESKIKIFFNSSSIIKEDFMKQFIIVEWLEQKLKKYINLELIFKTSENGFTSKDFHDYCDNKGPTLLLIKTTKDQIFGGFTPLNWGYDHNDEIIDKLGLTFLFSLTNNKIYDIINKEKEAIRNFISNGPYFGNSDLSLGDNLQYGVTFANSYCNFFSDNNLELVGKTGNYSSFEVLEFEVYKVIY